MKILERTVKRELNAAAGVLWWNLLDFEHYSVVHDRCTEAKVFFETGKSYVYWQTTRLPFFPFIKVSNLGAMCRVDDNTLKDFQTTMFNTPVVTTYEIVPTGKDTCTFSITYRFLLKGWRRHLIPIMDRMIVKWGTKIFDEDLPVIERRQKVLRHGFRDFVGMPAEVSARSFDGEIPTRLPVARLHDSATSQYMDL